MRKVYILNLWQDCMIFKVDSGAERLAWDTHNHLQTSGDVNRMNFNRTLDRAVNRLRGEVSYRGVLGVTNFIDDMDKKDDRYEMFSEMPGYERCTFSNGFYVPSKGIWVVKSQEVPTDVKGHEVHLLVVGLPAGEHVKPGRPLEDTMKEGKDLGGKLVFDHPGYTHGILPHLLDDPDLLIRVMPYADGWEVFNASAAFNLGPFPVVSRVFPPKANASSMSFYNEVIKPNYPHVKPLKSSDGHSLEEIGRAYTVSDIPRAEVNRIEENGERLVDALFRGVVSDMGKTTGSRMRCALHAAAVIKENGIMNTLGRFVRKKQE